MGKEKAVWMAGKIKEKEDCDGVPGRFVQQMIMGPSSIHQLLLNDKSVLFPLR